MVRFVHSSDWQLGARFRQFGAKAEALRAARLTTLRNALKLAQDRAIQIFLIAGDLFEDNQVSDVLVSQTVSIFEEFPDIQIYILPGNHDPVSGPEAVWNRPSFRGAPSHVHILREPGVVDLGGAMLVASPLSQKVSTTDPSAVLGDLTRDLSGDTIKIGITHGALAIEGKHQPNDFPIALNAATRAGLDYLAIGHWHNWLVETDGGRIIMPGTPEPDQFSNEGSGHVALVEIDGPGNVPRVQPLRVATLTWKILTFDFLSRESSQATLHQTLAGLRTHADRTVLRITLTGNASPQEVAALRAELEKDTAGFFFQQIIDSTRVAINSAELLDLQSRHPILAQVLADVDQLERYATGSGPANDGTEETASPMTLAEAQALLANSKIELATLPPEFFSQLRQILFQTLQEVST